MLTEPIQTSGSGTGQLRNANGEANAQTAPDPISKTQLKQSLDSACEALLGARKADGSWVFPLEADCTIPAEYILMMHYMDEIEPQLQSRLANYLRAEQTPEGGWSLYPGGAPDPSATVKGYWALKLAGDSVEAEHMVRARKQVHAMGGAERANVFTRIELALFRQLPWRGVPYMPVEALLLPNWFPIFSLSKVSYWSRTVMVPLLMLYTLKANAKNPTGIGVQELFVTPPEEVRDYFPVRSPLNRVFLLLERTARYCDPLIPAWVRKRAMAKAERWLIDRLGGLGGLGAIFPAMVKAYEVLDALGYAEEYPHRMTALQAIRELLVIDGDSAYCQPCVSPVWDTALASLALQEVTADRPQDDPQVEAIRAATEQALDWLRPQQLLDAPGDWRDKRPDLAGGGWPFQYRNDYYPDTEDTAAVAWAMHQSGQSRYEFAIERAANWVHGMQSKGGGFASFDVDNVHYHLNEIPFADHGALLDPPTSDVSARCVSLLGRLDTTGRYREAVERCLIFLREEQEEDGSWFGRWGSNYIYGTWSVLQALHETGEDMTQPMVQKAVGWLKSVQQQDGGWGESNDSYADPTLAGGGLESTSFQTAWALLGLMAAGEAHSPEVRHGIHWLMTRQGDDGLWQERWFTAPGFPRVFYLKYHGYSKYFPLWALARYTNLIRQPE